MGAGVDSCGVRSAISADPIHSFQRFLASIPGGLDRETPVSLEPGGMLTVFVFGERESRREKDLRSGLEQLGAKALLWVALRDPTEEEVAAVQEVFEFSDEQAHRLLFAGRG